MLLRVIIIVFCTVERIGRGPYGLSPRARRTLSVSMRMMTESGHRNNGRSLDALYESHFFLRDACDGMYVDRIERT